MEEISTMKSMKSMNFTGKQVLEVLENDFTFVRDYTKDLIEYYSKDNDYYTVSMLTDNLLFIEKELWMIKTSLI